MPMRGPAQCARLQAVTRALGPAAITYDGLPISSEGTQSLGSPLMVNAALTVRAPEPL
jgi:hypothetical protein